MAIIDKQFRQKSLMVIALLVASLVLQLITSPQTFSKDTLSVWVFDVGQGDAIFIDAPDKQILIDGGVGSVVLEKLTAVMPFWDRSIDIIINTHPHADHITGLNYVLERYNVEEVWSSGLESHSDTFAYFEELIESDSPPFEGGVRGGSGRFISSGYAIDLGNGATLEILWPNDNLDGQYFDDPNDASIVTFLRYGKTTVLLTGDIGVEQEVEFLGELEHADVLKVGHHGSKTSTSVDFLEAITPNYAIISSGENNSYGHPHSVVLDRLKVFNSIILRTDLDGDIRITSKGEEPQLSIFNL